MRAQQRTESTEGNQRIESAMQARGQPDLHHHQPEASLPPKHFAITTGTHLPWQASTRRFAGSRPRRPSALSSRGIQPTGTAIVQSHRLSTRCHPRNTGCSKGLRQRAGLKEMSGSFSGIIGKEVLDPEGAFLLILTGPGPVRKDPLQCRGKSGGSGGARTRNLCRDRAAL